MAVAIACGLICLIFGLRTQIHAQQASSTLNAATQPASAIEEVYQHVLQSKFRDSLPSRETIGEMFDFSKVTTRQLIVALESYQVDYNRYPSKLHQITTPIAYLTAPINTAAPSQQQNLSDFSTMPLTAKMEEVQRQLGTRANGSPPSRETLSEMLSLSKANPRNLARALESYQIDNNQYPAKLHQLTTPIAYLSYDPIEESVLPTLAAIPGKDIPREEAEKIIERLYASIYDPKEHIQTLSFEFEPKFIDMSSAYAKMLGSNFDRLAEGRKILNMEGIASVLSFIADEGLSNARKAVFYYQRTSDAPEDLYNFTFVRFFDEAGNRINVHRAIETYTGLSFLMVQQFQKQALLSRRYLLSQQKTYRLDNSNSDVSVLYVIDPPTRKFWTTKIEFTPDGKLLSTEKSLFRDTESVQFPSGIKMIFEVVSELGKVVLAKTESSQSGQAYQWGQINSTWIVQGYNAWRQKDPATPDSPRETLFDFNFSSIRVNENLVEDLFAEPASQPAPPQVDLSSPDATMDTILLLIRKGRTDLLQYCGVNPPNKPMPDYSFPSPFEYYYDTYKSLREDLKVVDKKQTSEGWTYTITLPQATKPEPERVEIQLKNINNEWRMDGDMGTLLTATFHAIPPSAEIQRSGEAQ